MSVFGEDLAALSKLLEAPAGNPTTAERPPALTPATLVKPPILPTATHQSKLSTARASSGKDIWDAEEIVANAQPDVRARPKFDFLYKQHVGAEDLYLGMSGKTPSSVDCEALVVKIELPGAKLSDIELDVTEDQIIASSRTHKLATFLPRKVRHKEGKAKWDASTQTLSVTVPMLGDGLFS